MAEKYTYIKNLAVSGPVLVWDSLECQAYIDELIAYGEKHDKAFSAELFVTDALSED
jgi:hypothetical protein